MLFQGDVSMAFFGQCANIRQISGNSPASLPLSDKPQQARASLTWNGMVHQCSAF